MRLHWHTLPVRPRKELRARAPDFASNRAASRKSKSYVGQAVLVLMLEGKPWRDLEAVLPLRKAPGVPGWRCPFRARLLGTRNPGLKPWAIFLCPFGARLASPNANGALSDRTESRRELGR
jgi:hypothetical protein